MQEAKDSSAIENIITTEDELFRTDSAPGGYGSVAAKEVHRYGAALKVGFERVRQQGFLRLDDVLAVQATLEQNRAEFRKLPGTVLKNAETGAVVYEPPQDAVRIEQLMDNFITRLNRSEPGDPDAILSAGWIVDALVTDEELLGWLSQTSSERLQYLGAEALARRSRFSSLVEFAWNQPGPVQLRILTTLTFAGPRDPSGRTRRVVRQPSFEDKEHLFWEHCAKTLPIETANALWDYEYASGRNPFNRLIHDPLRDHFKSEAARSNVEVEITQQQSYPLRTALQMLASWRMEEDDAVMTALLKHGAYTKEESWQGDNFDQHIVKKRFVYREIARQALIARGQAVQSNVVVESLISSIQENRGQ